MREKLKSKVVWLTAIPLIVNLIAMFCPGYAEQVGQIATTVVTLLAIFGILNNPDEHDHF